MWLVTFLMSSLSGATLASPIGPLLVLGVICLGYMLRLIHNQVKAFLKDPVGSLLFGLLILVVLWLVLCGIYHVAQPWLVSLTHYAHVISAVARAYSSGYTLVLVHLSAFCGNFLCSRIFHRYFAG